MDMTRKTGSYLYGSKCLFGKSSALFLRFVIDRDDPKGAIVQMIHEKIKAVSDWPYPTSPKEVCSFMGLSGVYRKFIPNFVKISALLMELISMEQQKYDECRAYSARWARVIKSVNFLKATIIVHPVLALPQKGNYNYLVHTDTSDFAIDAIL